MVIIMAWLCISFKPPKIDLAKNNMKKQDDTYLTLSMLYDDLLYENPADKQMAIDEVLNAVPPEISYQWLQQQEGNNNFQRRIIDLELCPGRGYKCGIEDILFTLFERPVSKGKSQYDIVAYFDDGTSQGINSPKK